MHKSISFTLKGNGILRILVTPIEVQNLHTGESISVKAIWDTGATGSVITKDVAKKLGLIPTGKTNVNTANGDALQNTYTVNIKTPNSLTIQSVIVTEVDGLSGGCEALIGMDIITLGDFSITNHNGKSCMSFRFPSSHEIDYVKNPTYGLTAIQKLGSTPSLNGPCPCGSGKQYKRCHGKK